MNAQNIMHDGETKIVKAYLNSAAAILILVAMLKICSLQSNVRFLSLRDPVFVFLNNEQIMAISAILELFAAVFLLGNGRALFKLTVLLGLSSILISYRIGLWWINPQSPCKCYGRATDWLHIQPETADTAMKCILWYFVLGSAIFLLLYHLTKRIPLTAENTVT